MPQGLALAAVRLVLAVIDIVNIHFKKGWPKAGLRSCLLAGMARDAITLAEPRGLALVFVNR